MIFDNTKARKCFIFLLCAIYLMPIFYGLEIAANEFSVNIPIVDFQKRGEVVSLVNYYDETFLVRKEYIDASGQPYSPTRETKISKQQFVDYYSSRAFDLVEAWILYGDNSFLRVFLNKDHEIISKSFAGKLESGEIKNVAVSGKERYSWLLKEGDRYYNVIAENEGRHYTYYSLSSTSYQEKIDKSEYKYKKEISKQKDNVNMLDTMTISYKERSSEDVEVSYTIKADHSASVAEEFFIINFFRAIDHTNDLVVYDIQGYLTKEPSMPDDPAHEQVLASIPDEYKEKYMDRYFVWTDTYNFGYVGLWEDPYYDGTKTIIEWNDPFWRQSEIVHGGGHGGVYGYYDDVGNFIRTDANGMPIPREPGTFDSSGNFRPKGVDGYYSPLGIFHPLHVNRNIYEEQRNVYIEDYGYINERGIFHAYDVSPYSVVINNNYILYTVGYLYNQQDSSYQVLDVDIWGKYLYGNKVIYNDYSVYDKQSNTLTLRNGTVLTGETTDNLVLFSNGEGICLFSFEKGLIENDYIKITGAGKIYSSGTIKYPKDITYTVDGVYMPSGEVLHKSFEDANKPIFLEGVGYIYPNSHMATKNEFGDLQTTADSIVYTDFVFLEDGRAVYTDKVLQGYADLHGNISFLNGKVINRHLEVGMYNSKKEFVAGFSVNGDGFIDSMGNHIDAQGVVTKVEVDAHNPLFVTERKGYYNEAGAFVEGDIKYENGFYTPEGVFVCTKTGIIQLPKENIGFFDRHKNYIVKDYMGGVFTKEGNYALTNGSITNNAVDSFGRIIDEYRGYLNYNFDGSIGIWNESVVYKEDGLFVSDGNTGYYDELGLFVLGSKNPYWEKGIFYDSYGKEYNTNSIYIDAKDRYRLSNVPAVGLYITPDNLVGVHGEQPLYTFTGLTEVEGEVGFYDKNGEFIRSDVSAYIHGFYTKNANWIDHSYIKESPEGDLSLRYAFYNYYGSYETISGDVGHFSSRGDFVPGKVNPFLDYYFDKDGNKQALGLIFKDDYGFVKNPKGNYAYDASGQSIMMQNNNLLGFGEFVLKGLGVFVNKEGKVGYFDDNSNFIEGKNIFKYGFFTPDGNWIDFKNNNSTTQDFIVVGGDSLFVVDGSFGPGGGVLFFFDGTAFVAQIKGNRYILMENGTAITVCGEVGTYENGFIPSQNTTITNSFWDEERKHYFHAGESYGYYNEHGTFIFYSGGIGYFDANGQFSSMISNPYINGFYTHDKKWIALTDNNPPNKGYLNAYGMPRNGDRKNEDGFYDFRGNYHLTTSNSFYDRNGNHVSIDETAVGYYDSMGNFYLYGKDGFFDRNGNFHVKNRFVGHYDKEGNLIPSRNVSVNGFFDMDKNYFPFGDPGYYTAKGEYIASTSGVKKVFYDEIGFAHDGVNPFINGYYTEIGEWVGNGAPMTTYYEKNGVLTIGNNPYKEGFYDMYGNWHLKSGNIYFDKNGTLNVLDDDFVGYYDKFGNLYYGTNPFTHGFYDKDRNLHLFCSKGYYSFEGHYTRFGHEQGYFNSQKDFLEGVNPFEEGFYDINASWHCFDKEYYIDDQSTKIYPYIYVDKYDSKSKDYILFEGVFHNIAHTTPRGDVTIQFSLNTHTGTKIVDTAKNVSTNAIVSYNDAIDIIHNIATTTNTPFIRDNENFICFVEGDIVTIEQRRHVTINDLNRISNRLGVNVFAARSRVKEFSVLTDVIEVGREIMVSRNGYKFEGISFYSIKNYPYMNFLHFISILDADYIHVHTDETEYIEIYKQGPGSGLIIRIEIDSGRVVVRKGGDSKRFFMSNNVLRVSPSERIEDIAIPISLIDIITSKESYFDTNNYILSIG